MSVAHLCVPGPTGPKLRFSRIPNSRPIGWPRRCAGARSGRPFIDLTAIESDARRVRLPADLLRAARRCARAALRAVAVRRARGARGRRRRLRAAGPRRPARTHRADREHAARRTRCCSSCSRDAGDEVLVPRPSYPLFEHLTRLDSGRRAALRPRVPRRVVDRLRERRARAHAADARGARRQPEQSDRLVRQRGRARPARARCARRAASRSSPTKCSPTTSSSPAPAPRAGRAVARRRRRCRSRSAGCRSRSACRR